MTLLAFLRNRKKETSSRPNFAFRFHLNEGIVPLKSGNLMVVTHKNYKDNFHLKPLNICGLVHGIFALYVLVICYIAFVCVFCLLRH